ncbi:hypothetical protein Tco_1353447 [Tanacetum coccineum]
MGTPTQYLCDYWSGWVRLPRLFAHIHCHIALLSTVEIFSAGGIFLYKTPNQAYELLEDKVLVKLDWAKNQKTKSSLKKTVAFAADSSSNSDTDKIIARMDAMTMKVDAQYKDFQSRSKQSKLDDDDIPMSREEETKFMKTFHLQLVSSMALKPQPGGHSFEPCKRVIIPSATSAADVAATWACRTQLADVALPCRLTWDLHADVACHVAD